MKYDAKIIEKHKNKSNFKIETEMGRYFFLYVLPSFPPESE